MLVASNITTGYVVKENVDHQRDMVEALAKMSRTNGPFIVMIGNSLTQNARLPASVCGIPLINAGIGGESCINLHSVCRRDYGSTIITGPYCHCTRHQRCRARIPNRL